MAVTIKDVLNLDIMKSFILIAGNRGLDRTIIKTELLDFEFVAEGEEYREKSFDGESLVLTSLLFAKDNPDLILDSIKRLIKLNVQALAYKPVIFKKLPQEAIDFANQKNFPIFQFGNDEYFEDIIFSIKELTEADGDIEKRESLLKDIVKNYQNKSRTPITQEDLNSQLKPLKVALCIKERGGSEQDIRTKIKTCQIRKNIKGTTFVGKLFDSYIVILSGDDEEIQLRNQYEELKKIYRLERNTAIIGYSRISSLRQDLEKLIVEAYWAEKVGEIEKNNVTNYAKLGIYQILISQLDSESTTSYMNDYLAPIFSNEDMDGELLKTAIEYVKAHGDAQKVADKLYCHKNTIRYRIGKLQEKLDPKAMEKEFYQNLSVAIKIYLLKELA